MYTQLGNNASTNFTQVTSNPNGNLAGNKNDKAFNVTDNVLYICTVSGTASTAFWTPMSGVLS